MVYLADDIRHHRKVSLKVLRPELSAVIGPERFLKEIELTAGLQHPHILPLFDSGNANGLLWYAMPFVEGETLRSRLVRDGPLSVDEAVRIAREVADALDHAHARGIVHRDVKPENILLRDGHALVADFGIALALEQAGGMVGQFSVNVVSLDDTDPDTGHWGADQVVTNARRAIADRNIMGYIDDSGSGATALTLPQSAVQLREGFSYVFKVGPDNKVTQAKIETGRRFGYRIEVTGRLAADARVVAMGGGFLAEGATVRVVDAPAAMNGGAASSAQATAPKP